MRVRMLSKVFPPKPPSLLADRGAVAAGAERHVWQTLVPRLLHPAKLAIVEALLEAGRPLSAAELVPRVEAGYDAVAYHCKSMLRAGVLEVAETLIRPDRSAEEARFFFPAPSRGARPASRSSGARRA